MKIFSKLFPFDKFANIKFRKSIEAFLNRGKGRVNNFFAVPSLVDSSKTWNWGRW